MPETPEPAASLPERIPAEPLRRIDWLAVAPWTLLLRAPAASFGWSLALGAIGSLLFGGWGYELPTPSVDPAVAIDSARQQTPWSLFDPTVPTTPLRRALSALGWLVIGVALSHQAAAKLTGRRTPSLRRSSLFAAKSLPQFLMAVALIAGAAGLLAAPLSLCGAATRWLDIEAAAPLVLLPAILFGVPLVYVSGGAIVGAPLLAAAIAVDRVDAFDALSRTYAYAWQRLGLLAWCVLVAATLGLAAGVLVELLLGAFLVTTNFVLGGSEKLLVSGEGVWNAFFVATRGFFPAYFFTAATAIYLVMRHAIDGQPLDEIAEPAAKV